MYRRNHQAVFIASLKDEDFRRFRIAEIPQDVRVRILTNERRQDGRGRFALGRIVRGDIDIFEFAFATVGPRRSNSIATLHVAAPPNTESASSGFTASIPCSRKTSC